MDMAVAPPKIKNTPKEKESDYSGLEKGWNVLLYNDEEHSQDYVVEVLGKCGKGEEEANKIMLDAHNNGYGVVHHEPDTEMGQKICEMLEEIIRDNGLIVKLVHV